MSRFMTTLGNLGLLAGQLDVAGKQKEAKQRGRDLEVNTVAEEEGHVHLLK